MEINKSKIYLSIRSFGKLCKIYKSIDDRIYLGHIDLKELKTLIDNYNSLLCLIENFYMTEENTIDLKGLSSMRLDFDKVVKDRKIFNRKYNDLKNKDITCDSEDLNFLLESCVRFEKTIENFLYNDKA